MSIRVSCEACGGELKEPGGLLFSPPDASGLLVLKHHLCTVCYRIVRGFVEKLLSEKSQSPG